MADDLVDEVVSFVKLAKAATEHQRKRELEDLKFQIPEMTWSEEAAAARRSTTINGVPIPARPMLSLATLDEPLQLVENGYRDAHLGVNIHPLSADANKDTAEVLQGIYRSIEVNSRAAAVGRAWAYARSLRCGTGGYRIISEFDPNSPVPGDQRLIIKRILFQESVYLDPFAEEPDWSDGEKAAIISDLPFTTYKRKYKKTALANYSDEELLSLGSEKPDWVGGEGEDSRTVRIAEYFYVEHVDDPIPGKPGQSQDRRVVKWVKVNGIEVLERGSWPGPYIPIVPTIGKELQPFDGKRRWIGMITNAKDGVRLTNYAASGAVEMAALEPKAPWMMEEGVDEGYEWEYQQANIRNMPSLHHRSLNKNGQKFSAPSRVQVDAGRLGPNMMLLQMGKDFVQSATQTYEPSLGKQTPAHRSGEAIKALQGQGIEGTSNYTGNLADISMTLEANIMLWAIPHFYDRAGRVETILDGEDKPRQVMLNQPFVHVPKQGPQQAQPNDPNALHYDLSAGRYGVTITVGKSSKSKLEQGESEIGQIMQASPEMVPLIGPIYFKYRDGPGMKEVASLLQKQRDHAMPWLSDNPNQPNVAQLMAENQHLKQTAQQMQQVIATKQVEQRGKLQVTQLQEQSETERAGMERETKLSVAAINGLAKEMADFRAFFMEERARLGAQQDTQHDRAHDVGMAGMEHQQAMQQAAAQQQHDAEMARMQAAHQADASAQEHGQGMIQQAAAPEPSNNGSGS